MTLAAAVRSEVFKLARNRASLWCAFWLVPVVLFLFAVALEALMPTAPQLKMIVTNPVRQAASAFASAGNPLIQLFYAIGAAGLFAGEYRWETWRLIATRNARLNLILAKFAAYKLFAAASLALIGMGALAASFYGPLFHGAPTAWPSSPAGLFGQIGIGFIAGLLELTTLGALVALGAIATRSVLGGVVPALMIGFAQLVATSYLDAPTTLSWPLLIPRFAAAALRDWGVSMSGAAHASPLLGLAGGVILIGWSAGLLLFAAGVFRSQDLARE